MRFLHGRSGWPKSGHFQAFPFFRVPSLSPSTQRTSRSAPVTGRDEAPRPVSGVVVRRCGFARSLLPFLGSSLPGLLLVLPVAFGAGLAPGLVRNGGSPAFHTDAQELGLVPSFLDAAPHPFLALWSLGSLAFVLAAFLLPGFQLCWCRLYPWLRRPGLGRGLP